MKNRDIDQLIDKFVNGTITTEEKEWLQSAVKSSPEVKQNLDLRKDLVKSIQYMENESLRTLLDKIHQEEIKPKVASKLKALNKYLIILGLILIATAVYFTLFTNTRIEHTGPQYFAENYAPYIPSIGDRGSAEDYQYDFVDLYKSQKYQEALKLFESSNKAFKAEEILLAGISAMETENYANAILYFDQIINSKDYFFNDHAVWYKALVYLKTSKTKDAIPLLKQLAMSPNKDHSKEAKLILGGLN